MHRDYNSSKCFQYWMHNHHNNNNNNNKEHEFSSWSAYVSCRPILGHNFSPFERRQKFFKITNFFLVATAMATKDASSATRIAKNREIALNAGRRLARCKPGEEVMITGIAGVFPDSDNVRHFGENLLSKKDLISDDDRRWKLGNFSSRKSQLRPRKLAENYFGGDQET